jgi:hypothetical protein
MAISAQFTADFTQWKSAVDAAQGDVDQLRQATEKFTPAVGLLASEVGGQIRAVGADILGLAKDYVSAFAEEEAATAALTAALEATGTASAGVVDQYAAMADQFQATTTFAGDAVTKAQTIFTTIGKVGPENMNAALTAAADLATFMGTDLETAATTMARAFGSGGESLGRLKQLLGDTAPEAADFDSIMEALNKKFGGQAAAAMDTTAGKMTNLKNQFGEIEETVGGLILKGLTPLMDFFMGLPEPVQTVIATVGVLGTALAPIAIGIGSLVTAAAPLVTLLMGAGGLSVAFGAVSAALAALAPFLLPAGAIIAGIAAVYLAFKNWDAIKDFVAGVYNSIKTYLVDKFQALLASIRAPIDAVTGIYRDMWTKVAGQSYVPDMIDTVASEFSRLPAEMTRPAVEETAKTTAAFAAMAAKIEDQTRAWISSPFNRLTKNMMTITTDSGGVARDPWGRPVAVDIPGGVNLVRSMGQQNIQVTINGNVLSTQEQIAMAMNEAMMRSYRQGGNRAHPF